MINTKTLSVFLAASVSMVFVLGIVSTESEHTGLEDNLQLKGNVIVEKNDEVVSNVNNVMLDGERIIRQQVTGDNNGDSTSSGFNTIALGNGDDTNAFTETDSSLSDNGARYGLDGQGHDHASGLEPAEAESYNELSEQGQWEIEHTFTAGETAEVSQTAIEIDGQTAASTDGPFIDNSDTNTFAATGLERTIPLEADDQLTITWEITPQNQ